MAYPKEFLWGVSTAAAQVEGGAAEDGRSPSIWDAFAAEKKVMNAKYFPTACDSYHRFFSRDLANLKALGVNSYRMSLSWSRVLPEGTGKLNEKGVDYYKRAFEALLEEGITPNVTLYHWDLPQVLEDRGGWANRDCIEWFGEYAEKMFRLYSDLVPYFATVNEPIATYIGYAKGKFAPGHKDETLGNRARHNLLVAHGRAVEAFRAVASKSARSASSSTFGRGTQSIPPRKTLPPSATRTSAIGSSIPIPSSAGRIPIISYLRLPAKGRSWTSKRAILPASMRPSTFSG